MNELTKEDKVFFDKLRKEWANQRESFLFGLVHEMNIEPTTLFVRANLNPPAMSGLIAYIELIAFDITAACSYSLNEEEIMEIMNKFYIEVTFLKTISCKAYDEIDLYWNWEYHSSFPYKEGMPEWEREGLLDYIKEMSIRHQWGVVVD